MRLSLKKNLTLLLWMIPRVIKMITRLVMGNNSNKSITALVTFERGDSATARFTFELNSDDEDSNTVVIAFLIPNRK